MITDGTDSSCTDFLFQPIPARADLGTVVTICPAERLSKLVEVFQISKPFCHSFSPRFCNGDLIDCAPALFEQSCFLFRHHSHGSNFITECELCIYSRNCSAYSSVLGTRLLLIMILAQEFQRRIASSFPAGRISSAFSNHSIASRNQSYAAK